MSVVDGEEVDWGGVYRSAASDEQRLLIAQLETVARIQTVATTMPRWGTLRLLEELGPGGFGVVHRAWDTNLEREVALKLYRRERIAPRSEGAFAEGRLLARVRHPNVVSVYGIDAVDEQVGLWMELVRGKTLADLLEQQGP